MLLRLAILGLLLSLPVFAQDAKALTGTVTTDNGAPIPGVLVYTEGGGRNQVETDKKGEFRIENPGTVVHFDSDKFVPKTQVVPPGISVIQVVMSPSTNNLTIPICSKARPNEAQLGWGDYEIRFTVDKESEFRPEIRAGKPDVDNKVWYVKRRGGSSWLQLLFGPGSFLLNPADELFIGSADFVQRNISRPGGAVIGRDSSGHDRKGLAWRATGVVGSGVAIYEAASPEDAEFFNLIADSICEAALPPGVEK
jgi:hypothetical protein